MTSVTNFSNADTVSTQPSYYDIIFIRLDMFAGSWFGDRYRKRALIVQINSLFNEIGLPIMGFHHIPPVRYFGILLAVVGVDANVPATMAWQAKTFVNNGRGPAIPTC
ncbi:hypothetical protein J3459_010649 [Metarhizium acridum]|nr:hypothetical protein J3459_010649 [Metarhizium acridum]